MSPTKVKNRISNKKQKSVDILIDEAKDKGDFKHNSSLQLNALQSIEENFHKLDCNCESHSGKEYLNQTFELDFDYLYECLFGFNQFHSNFYQLRKITGSEISF